MNSPIKHSSYLPVCVLIFALFKANAANPIQTENAIPGTTTWQLSSPADARQIEGYASLTSVNVGGQIKFFVNTADSTYNLAIYRMGWYGGSGGRLLHGPV